MMLFIALLIYYHACVLAEKENEKKKIVINWENLDKSDNWIRINLDGQPDIEFE